MKTQCDLIFEKTFRQDAGPFRFRQWIEKTKLHHLKNVLWGFHEIEAGCFAIRIRFFSIIRDETSQSDAEMVFWGRPRLQLTATRDLGRRRLRTIENGLDNLLRRGK